VDEVVYFGFYDAETVVVEVEGFGEGGEAVWGEEIGDDGAGEDVELEAGGVFGWRRVVGGGGGRLS
jgi:hypothetical protein